MSKHYLASYLIILNVRKFHFKCLRRFTKEESIYFLGENLDKFNLIPSREKLQSTSELRSFENNQDFQQALSAIYSSLLTR